MSEAPVRLVRERLVHENPYVRLYDDDVVLPGGRAGRFVRLTPTAPGPGVVLVVLRAGRLAVVRTYRYPLGSWQWAFPRGFGQSEDVLHTASAELLEETGVRDAELTLLGHLTPDSGVQSSRVAIVLAETSAEPGPPTDVEEVEAVRWLLPSELEAEVASGDVEDGFTLAALTVLRVSRPE